MLVDKYLQNATFYLRYSKMNMVNFNSKLKIPGTILIELKL